MEPPKLSVSAATLLVLGGWFLCLYAGGRAGSYLDPASEFALLLTGAGLLALAAFNLLHRRHPLPAYPVSGGSCGVGGVVGKAQSPSREATGPGVGPAVAGLVILAPLALASLGSKDRLSAGGLASGASWRGSEVFQNPPGSAGWPGNGEARGMPSDAGSAPPALGGALFPGAGSGASEPGGRSFSSPGASPGGPAPTTTRRTQAGSGWFFPVPPVLREEAAKGGRVSREQSYLLPRRARGGGGVGPAEGGVALLGGLAGADAFEGVGAEPFEFPEAGDEEPEPFTLAELEELVDRNGYGEYLLNIPQIYHSVGDEEVMAVLEGLPVEVTAQLTEETPREAGARRLKAYRFSVDCCPTHSRGISIPLDFEGPATSFEEHGWYRFHGKVRFRSGSGESGESGSQVPSIEVSRFVPTEEPAAEAVF